MRERKITAKVYSLANNAEKATLILEAVEQAASFYKRRTPSAASYKLLPIHSVGGIALANNIINASGQLETIAPYLREAWGSPKATTAHSLYSYLAQSLYNVLPGLDKISLEHGWAVSKKNTEANAAVFGVVMQEIERLTQAVGANLSL